MPDDFIYKFGPFELHSQSRQLWKNGVLAPLPEAEFRILEHMVSHPGVTFTEAELIEVAWGARAEAQANVDGTIAKLQQLFGDDSLG